MVHHTHSSGPAADQVIDHFLITNIPPFSKPISLSLELTRLVPTASYAVVKFFGLMKIRHLFRIAFV